MGSGLPQRWQLRSPGGLATPHAGLAHKLGGPSASAGPEAVCRRKPQSMQETEASSSGELHWGHLVGVGGAAARLPLLGSGAGAGRGGTAANSPVGTAANAPVDAAAPALGGGAGGAGTMNGFLHDGHDTRLPATLS